MAPNGLKPDLTASSAAATKNDEKATPVTAPIAPGNDKNSNCSSDRSGPSSISKKNSLNDGHLTGPVIPGSAGNNTVQKTQQFINGNPVSTVKKNIVKMANGNEIDLSDIAKSLEEANNNSSDSSRPFVPSKQLLLYLVR